MQAEESEQTCAEWKAVLSQDEDAEAVVDIEDLGKGQMKEFKCGEVTGLLIRKHNGELACVGSRCPHYGAPLVKGVLNGDRLSCPWHTSSFKLPTGQLLEAPSLDALPAFPVRVSSDGRSASVKCPQTAASVRSRCVSAMACASARDEARCFVIVGGGAAALAAAEALRQGGFRGKITLLTNEARLPYDRTRLSKQPDKAVKDDGAALSWRPPAFYLQYGIDVAFESTVVDVDSQKRLVQLKGGTTITFDKLLIASGASPKRLAVPGHLLQNIFAIRTPLDSALICQALGSGSVKNVLIVGSGFIGLEMAAYLSKQSSLKVTVVSEEEAPLAKRLGPRIGKAIQAAHEKSGVRFVLGSRLQHLDGKTQVEKAVVVSASKQETTLPADLVLVCIGVTLNTCFVCGHDGQIQLNDKDGAIKVDKFLQATDNVFAAGDVCEFPVACSDGRLGRVEHWVHAQNQGRVAAFNMLDRKIEYNIPPFFWTEQKPLNVRFAGYCPRWDSILYDGDVEALKFVAFFVEGGRVRGVASSQRDPAATAAVELLRLGLMPSVEELKRGAGVDLPARLAEVSAHLVDVSLADLQQQQQAEQQPVQPASTSLPLPIERAEHKAAAKQLNDIGASPGIDEQQAPAAGCPKPAPADVAAFVEKQQQGQQQRQQQGQREQQQTGEGAKQQTEKSKT